MEIKVVRNFVSKLVQSPEFMKGNPTVNFTGEKAKFARIMHKVLAELQQLHRSQTLTLLGDKIARLQDKSPKASLSPEKFYEILSQSAVQAKEASPPPSAKVTKEEKAPIDSFKQKENAVVLLQSLIRSYMTQSRVILPKELRPFLKQHLKDASDEQIEAFTQMIARESVKMLEDPNAYTDEGVRFSKQDEYGVGKKKFTLPKTLWIQLSPDKRSVRVQFYEKRLVGQGTYKKVKASKTVVIGLTQRDKKPKMVEETVLVRSKDNVSPEDKIFASAKQIEKWIDEDIQNMKGTIQAITQVFSIEEIQKDPELKLAGIPKTIRTHKGKKRKKIEWEESRFTTDMSKASKEQVVPTDTTGKQNIPLSSVDKLRLTESLLYTLDKMHEKGKVHRDVKPPNVLLRYNADEKMTEGYLTDYDLITDFGPSRMQAKYAYWDLCSVSGMVLPTTDIFGAMTCLADMTLGFKLPLIVGENLRYAKPKQIPQTVFSFYLEKVRELTQNLMKSLTKEQKNLGSLIYPHLQKKRLEAVDAMIEELESMGSEKNKQILRNFKAEIHLANDVQKLVGEMYAADRKLYTFLRKKTKESEKLVEVLKDPKLSLQKKQEAIQEIYKKFPIFKDFASKVKALRLNYEKTLTS